MAAEVAISCGDPTEAQLACAAVTQAVDDSGASGHLTLLDQVCGIHFVSPFFSHPSRKVFRISRHKKSMVDARPGQVFLGAYKTVGWGIVFSYCTACSYLLFQVLRETKFHLLVGQTAILSQDWESAEMSLQLAVDMSGSVKEHAWLYRYMDISHKTIRQLTT